MSVETILLEKNLLAQSEFSETFDFQHTSSYSPQNNYFLAQVCALSYETEEGIEAQVEEWEKNTSGLFLSVEVVDVSSDRFLILSNDAYLILAFRGSENIGNLLTDIDIILSPYENIESLLVHEGFYTSVLQMRQLLGEALRKYHKPGQTVHITGHSLGGAQAVLSAYLIPELENFDNLTTFGCPKIGDSNLTALFNESLNSSPVSNESRIYRFVNKYDPVPYVPIFYGFNFYYHPGFFYLYSAEEGTPYRIESTSRLYQQEKGEDLIPIPEVIFGSSLNYHAISLYVANAKANLNNPIFS